MLIAVPGHSGRRVYSGFSPVAGIKCVDRLQLAVYRVSTVLGFSPVAGIKCVDRHAIAPY